jgi:RNA polymerase sigma-32 factor
MAAELLDAETEAALARAWRNDGDERALHRLVTAYLRLAIAMAAKYRRYGAPMNDLIQEAGVGLMKAASKFDPDRGVRFSTYAVWWIKASIQDYVMRNWSLVRTGSTSAQKSLFFNMRRVRAKVESEMEIEGRDATSAEIQREIAAELGVPLRDVTMMETRLSGADFSLNAQQAGEDGREWVETLEDNGPGAEEQVARDSDLARARSWLSEALEALSAADRAFLEAWYLEQRDPVTLAEEFGIALGTVYSRRFKIQAKLARSVRRLCRTRQMPEAAASIH